MTPAEAHASAEAGRVRNAFAVLGVDHETGAIAGAAIAFAWLAFFRLWEIK